MVGFLIWLLLLVVCWPLALLALVLYPVVPLLLRPGARVLARHGHRARHGKRSPIV